MYVLGKRLGAAFALLMSLSACNFGPGSSGAAPAAGAGLLPLASNFVAPPEVVSSHGVATFNLQAVINSTNNLPAFLYKGSLAAPTIRVKPGDSIVVYMDDELPAGTGMGSDMNLHFHGLNVSPLRPHDDVLGMLATPGRALYYLIKIPVTQPPGLYWYHPHVHGETNYQVGEGGMSGAIVVEGIGAHLPALAKMQERLLVVRQLGSNGGEVVRAPNGDAATADGMASMRAPRVAPVKNVPCAPEPSGVFLTVDSQLQPAVHFKAGQPVFYRVLNATGHRHLDLSLGGIPMQIVAFDGYPVDTNPNLPPTLTQTHVIVPPAGRVEFVARVSVPTDLRTLCFDSGPIGDADPEEVLAHLRPDGVAAGVGSAATTAPAALHVGVQIARTGIAAALPPPAATRTVRFSEDVKGFYINGQMFSPSAPPMFVVHTGTVERWQIENLTLEDHDFHLHQAHFLVVAQNGVPEAHPLWRDTMVIPHRVRQPNGSTIPGTITVIADFRDPQIRGVFLFHCHILDHEDQGMMAKIQAI